MNKRGATIVSDLVRLEKLIQGFQLQSTPATKFDVRERKVLDELAEAVHTGTILDDKTEAETLEFLQQGRERFTGARIETARLLRAGLSPEEAVEAMKSSRLDPFSW